MFDKIKKFYGKIMFYRAYSAWLRHYVDKPEDLDAISKWKFKNINHGIAINSYYQMAGGERASAEVKRKYRTYVRAEAVIK